jgi:hypothetical protein
MNSLSAEILNKQIQIEISRNAQQQLDKRTSPLFIEMELYFSCMIRKQVRVREGLHDELDKKFSIRVLDNLHISFRPVMTKSCSIKSCDNGKPPLSDFPIQKPESYIPKWLKLDYKKNEWCGEFGYSADL